MGLNISETDETYQAAFLLPVSLYVIFSKLSAYVNIKGMLFPLRYCERWQYFENTPNYFRFTGES